MHCWGHQGWEALLETHDSSTSTPRIFTSLKKSWNRNLLKFPRTPCLRLKELADGLCLMVKMRTMELGSSYRGSGSSDGVTPRVCGVMGGQFFTAGQTAFPGLWLCPFPERNTSHTSGQNCVWTIRAALQEVKQTRSWCTFKCDTSWRSESRDHCVCLRYSSSACSHLSGWLLQWKRREGEQRVSTQNKHRSPHHNCWYSERLCIC